MHLSVHCRTIYNSQDMQATWMFIDRWMGKEDVVCIHIGILLSHKRDESESSAVKPESDIQS